MAGTFIFNESQSSLSVIENKDVSHSFQTLRGPRWQTLMIVFYFDCDNDSDLAFRDTNCNRNGTEAQGSVSVMKLMVLSHKGSLIYIKCQILSLKSISRTFFFQHDWLIELIAVVWLQLLSASDRNIVKGDFSWCPLSCWRCWFCVQGQVPTWKCQCARIVARPSPSAFTSLISAPPGLLSLRFCSLFIHILGLGLEGNFAHRP